MATFISLSNNGVNPLPAPPNALFPGPATFPRAPVPVPVSGTRIPLLPLPGGTGAGSWAIGLAPLALPFLAILSRWLQ